MGSKGRIPTLHQRRPPFGPGIMHPDQFGTGMHPPMPGAFPPFDMLPPPEVMEQKIAAQHVEMQKLATENQRLAATHGTLRQELAAAQHELQILHGQIGVMKSERELQIRNLVDKNAKMEAELQTAEAVKLELQKAKTEAQNLAVAREEVIAKVHQLNQDLQRAHTDVQQIPALMSELERFRQEYHHCRGTYEYEKKFYNDHLESLQVMEKNFITMATEVEKLRAQLTNAPNVDRRIDGSYGGVTGNIENETSRRLMGQHAYGDGYGILQGFGPPPSATTAGNAGVGPNKSTGAYVGAQSGTPVTAGYDAPRAGGYEASKGPGNDSSKGPSYDAQRGPNYDLHKGSNYDPYMQRGTQRVPGYDSQRGHSYNSQRDPSYDVQRGQGYDIQRGSGYDPSRGTGYDGAPTGGIDSFGRVRPPMNKLPYGSATPPATSGNGYEAPPRGGNPARR